MDQVQYAKRARIARMMGFGVQVRRVAIGCDTTAIRLLAAPCSVPMSVMNKSRVGGHLKVGLVGLQAQ
ncbi:MAG: hypothetical protein ACJAVR_000967 [Paracoccaceae bacterium]|jgi:hypothetical protein